MMKIVKEKLEIDEAKKKIKHIIYYDNAKNEILKNISI